MQVVETINFDLCKAERMAAEIKEYMIKSKSESTRRAYRADWKYFVQWCEQEGLQSMPAQIPTIAGYMIYLSKTHKAATLDRKILSIKQAHAFYGHPIDKNDTILRDTMIGIKNTIGTTQTTKAPILTEDLKCMVSHCGDNLIGKRNRALFLLGFSGAFRRSELVSLKGKDLKFTDNGLEVTLRKSKTDQQGKGCVVPIPYGSNFETCPVRSMKKWLDSSGIVDGFIFPSITKSGKINEKALGGNYIATMIKKNPHIKDKDMDFSGHSLRAGFCTQAAINNIPMHSCMKQARQKKIETHLKYVRVANLWSDCPSAKLGL